MKIYQNHAMTDAEGNFTLNNLTSISGYGSVFARSLLLALIATVICLIIGIVMIIGTLFVIRSVVRKNAAEQA